MKIFRYDPYTRKIQVFHTPVQFSLVPEYFVDGKTVAVGTGSDGREQRKCISKFRRLHSEHEIVKAELRPAWIFARTHSHEWVITVRERVLGGQGRPWSEVPSNERRLIMLRSARREMKEHFERTGTKLGLFATKSWAHH